jgi:aerobic carbon-monoxide dehydrogenase medium subunit
MNGCVFENSLTHVPGMLLPRFEYHAPADLDEAIRLMSPASGGCLLAGGTDLLVKMKRGLLRPRLLVSLRRVPGLREIAASGDGPTRIGALATMSALAGHAALTGTALAEGAASVGGPLIRNRATVGGNIVNARPCADTVPPLLALGALLRLRGPEGERVAELDGFIRGPGETALRRGEVLTAIELPSTPPELRAGSAYLKLTRRSSMEVTIVGCAASLQLGPDGKVRRARLVLTSVAPVPLRVTAAEPILEGGAPAESAIASAAATARAAARPIDDHRAPASYRAEMVEVLARRALVLALARADRRRS